MGKTGAERQAAWRERARASRAGVEALREVVDRLVVRVEAVEAVLARVGVSDVGGGDPGEAC